MVTRHRATQPRNGGLIPRMDKRFSPKLPDRLRVPSSYLLNEYRGIFSVN
jgi:hypothetical protein